MMRKSSIFVLFVCTAYASVAFAADSGEPPYKIVLRSRDAVVTPQRSKDSQTGGGYIRVTRVAPNVLMVLMRGTAAAGSTHCRDGAASLQFHLHQDFEIVPTRAHVRPPRLTFAAWLIGGLQSTLKEGGSAEHGPACAAVRRGEHTLLQMCVKPHAVGGGENLIVNDRVGPLETVTAPGGYCLDQTFALNANQPKWHCHLGGAAADFDPQPKLDPRWNKVLKPFRAVPHGDFGFRVVLRVVEDAPPPGIPTAPAEILPSPRKSKIDKISALAPQDSGR